MARANQRGHVDSDAELGRAGDARTETIRTVATLWPPFHPYLRRQSRCSTLIPHRSQQSRSSHHSRSRSDLGSCVRLPQDVKLASGMRQQQGKGGGPADLELISAAADLVLISAASPPVHGWLSADKYSASQAGEMSVAAERPGPMLDVAYWQQQSLDSP